MEKVILTNMCMILDEKHQRVVIQNRRKKDWSGYAFPGGHVEQGEAIVPSVIREMREETGLEIGKIQLIGIRDWYDQTVNERTVSFLFVAKSFQGTLINATEEGEVFWIQIEDLPKLNFAYGFKDQLPLFLKQIGTEIFSYKEDEKWKYIFY